MFYVDGKTSHASFQQFATQAKFIPEDLRRLFEEHFGNERSLEAT